MISTRFRDLLINQKRKNPYYMNFSFVILLLLFLIVVYLHYSLPNYDKSIGHWLSSRMTQSGNIFFGLISDLGDFQLILPFTFALMVYFLWKRNWITTAGLFFCVFGGGLFSNLLKYLFQQPGTDVFHTNVLNGDFGFPSGHTIMGVLFYGYLAYFLAKSPENQKVRWICLGCAGFISFLIGLSRLLIGVHLPTDVLSGWVIGMIWLLISIDFNQRIDNLAEIKLGK
jgi:membrane-associated phospholipid phosphatase